MSQPINAFLSLLWECPAFVKLICTKYVCTLTSHARFNYTSQLAGGFVFLPCPLRFTKVDPVVSNCSLKRLHQSTTIYLFLFAFISVTPFCFSPSQIYHSSALCCFCCTQLLVFFLSSELCAIIGTKINIIGK